MVVVARGCWAILLGVKSPLSSPIPPNASILVPDLEPYKMHWRAKRKKGISSVV